MMLVLLLSFFAILFDRFVPVHLLITALTVTGWFYTGRRVVIPAIMLGLVLDITLARPMGLTSIILIIYVTGMIVARLQFEWKSGLFVILISIVGELLMRMYLGQVIAWQYLLAQGILTGVVWSLFSRMRFREGVYLK